MTAAPQVTVLPEMLGRKDTKQGPWDVHECAPVRGMPSTNIVDKIMLVPQGSGEMERCVRAHEMMHAKVSPADEFDQWVARNVASIEALRAVEEVRVNHLCNLAGFDVKKHLSDGGEAADGERVVLADDWAAAVYTTVAYMETASLNQFITGVRRHSPEWAAALRAIVNRVNRMIGKIPKQALASTGVHHGTGLSPSGFMYTEQIAEFIDRLAHPPVPETDEDEATSKPGDGEGNAGDGTDTDGSDLKAKAKKKGKKAPVSDEDIKKSQPRPVTGRGWIPLKPFKMPLDRPAPGGLGKRRSPTMIGRSPRRIERMLTDPHRRVFDRVTRGNGGVVLIDASGSMALSTQAVRSLVEAAPGATVAMYAADNDDQPTNLWVLAERGRMVSNIPSGATGNGCDLPAIEWAIQQRQRSSSPVVWITDGYCFGESGNHDWDAFECLQAAMKHKVIVRPDVPYALAALGELAKGKQPQVWWPDHWRRSFRKYQGKALRCKKLPSLRTR